MHQKEIKDYIMDIFNEFNGKINYIITSPKCVVIWDSKIYYPPRLLGKCEAGVIIVFAKNIYNAYYDEEDTSVFKYMCIEIVLHELSHVDQKTRYNNEYYFKRKLVEAANYYNVAAYIRKHKNSIIRKYKLYNAESYIQNRINNKLNMFQTSIDNYSKTNMIEFLYEWVPFVEPYMKQHENKRPNEIFYEQLKNIYYNPATSIKISERFITNLPSLDIVIKSGQYYKEMSKVGLWLYDVFYSKCYYEVVEPAHIIYNNSKAYTIEFTVKLLVDRREAKWYDEA